MLDPETIYVCPMHPQIRQNKPGECPICGMTLEPEKGSKSKKSDQEYLLMLKKFWIAATLSFPLLIINMSAHFIHGHYSQWVDSSYSYWLQFALATPVVFWCGGVFFERGWRSLKNRHLNMFTLIAMGIGVAYGFSTLVILFPTFLQNASMQGVYFEAAAIITTLVLLGQVLELKARSKTSMAIQQLLALAPEMAWIIRADGSEEEILVSALKVGDKLRVKPGERIPTDGHIIEGSSAIDQSMITGESLPVEKRINEKVIGGTINGSGNFVMLVNGIGKDTMLAKIVEMVSNAQHTRAPIERLVDQVSGFFVPTVILIAIIAGLSWYFLGPQPKISYSLLASIAVLIIACPCALGLATPMSIMVGTGRGAKDGILIKNAEALETFEKINTLVVDKTGTLTEGKPSLMEIVPYHEATKDTLLQFAASIEHGSEHPLADAIVTGARSRKIALLPYQNFRSETGQGVIGTIQNHEILFGNAKLMTTHNILLGDFEQKANYYRQQGHTVMFLAMDGNLQGFLTVMDAIKSNAKETIQALKSLGMDIIMLTGDSLSTAQAIAHTLGIKNVKAEILPDSKYEEIRELQNKGFIVAMAGDGINDAPALTQADVGIAMGTGTDVAIESAGITLMSGDLNGILKAKHLSHLTMQNIRQNLFLAFIYNALAIPVAAGVFYPFFGWLLNPMLASGAMAFSSVSVIINALRLSKAKL